MEFGTRADTWPSEKQPISSYVFAQYPDALSNDTAFPVPVLSVARTFWERATILHAEYHRPEGKPLQLRIARHYYDLSCLADSPFGEGAIKNVALLERVAHHKNLLFRTGWARYNQARRGTLRLVPNNMRMDALRTDYGRMRDMFFRTPPEFDELMDTLRKLEGRINEPDD